METSGNWEVYTGGDGGSSGGSDDGCGGGHWVVQEQNQDWLD